MEGLFDDSSQPNFSLSFPMNPQILPQIPHVSPTYVTSHLIGSETLSETVLAMFQIIHFEPL